MNAAKTEIEKLRSEMNLVLQRAERHKVGRDIAEKLLEQKSSELYRTNEALRKSQENLEEEVAQATQELKDSNVLLTQALEEKSTFIGSLSHELRTPMNAVIGLSELLLDMPMGKLQKDYVSTIFESASGLIKLINSVLDISKIEAGKVYLTPGPTDCRKVATNVIRMFSLEAGRQQNELTLEVREDVPDYLFLDEGRFTQILTNLVSNAIKNTENGKIHITISVSKGKSGANLTTQVSDSGVGITAENIEKIFTAYEQFGNLNQGVGLGLAICRFLTDLMDGDLRCESELGIGSKFFFSIPLVDCSQEIDTQENLVDEERLKQLRVLIAEDNPVNQKVLAAQFLQFGIQPTIVDNGQLAIDELEKNDFNVVFLDLQMPVLDGEKALQHIRSRIIGGDKLYCVALTATSYYTKREEMLKAGFNEFLSKPLVLSELKIALGQVLSSDVTLLEISEDAVEVMDAEFDLTFLETQFGDAANEILRQLAPVFLEHSYEELEQLKSAILNKESPRIRKLSHSLKGAVATLGQIQLADLFEAIEKAADEVDTTMQLDKIQSQMNKLKTSLKQFLADA